MDAAFPNSAPNGSGQSAWSPLIGETEALMNLLRDYEIALAFPFSQPAPRNDIVYKARLIEISAARVINSEEDGHLSATIASMKQLNKIMKPEPPTVLVENFRNIAEGFLKSARKSLQGHNLGIKIKERQNKIKTMCSALMIKDTMLNGFGIPVSFEMVQFCYMLRQRALDKFDNIVCIEGPTGIGKSTFAIGMLTTYASIAGVGWDWNKNLAINESKEDVVERLAALPHYAVFQLDEAGNQINRRQWYDPVQMLLTNFTTRMRFKNFTVAVLWPNIRKLDPDLATDRSVVNVSISERAYALIKSFNKNTYAATPQFRPEAAKMRWASSGKEAHEIAVEYDLSVIDEIPFYEIPANIWEGYEQRKSSSLTVEQPKSKQRKDDELKLKTKETVIKLMGMGKSYRQIARRLGVSHVYVSHIIREYMLTQLPPSERAASATTDKPAAKPDGSVNHLLGFKDNKVQGTDDKKGVE
jgi:hypothetical protein